MKISLRWLSRYVDLDDLTAEEVRDHLTLSTAEIEAIEVFGGGIDDVVVGRVLEAQRHADADKLTLTRVDVGGDAPLAIVCGAPNVAAGQTVAVATPGAALPGGVKIKKAKIRGVESCGMICSERELGLSDAHEGIMVLEGDARPGTRLTAALPITDRVLEIDNKSVNHRPDLWGHYGFARELSAILRRPLRELPVATRLPERGRTLDIAIEDRADCPRFTGVVIEGVRVQRSPAWLRWLLAAVGQRAINLPVDLTNFVMLEISQPMHAFDLRFLDARGIGVRRARPGERITTLDDVERALEPTDLVVACGERAVGLAGIMGGAGSAVADDTSELFLESANFHPARIRRTSNRLGLRTDASARFEKSLDPAGAEQGSRRFLHLLAELCPGARVAGPLVDPAQWKFAPRAIELRRPRLDLKLGHVVPIEEVTGILERLQFGVIAHDGGWTALVPSFRATKDIAIEDDLIEEVGRMFRYDNIPEQPLRSLVTTPRREPELYLAREILRIGATEMACHEVYNYSFVHDAVLAAVHASEQSHAVVANPVTPETSRVRRSVLPSLLASLAINLRHDAEVRLMEHGKGYHPEARDELGLPREVAEIGFAFCRREGAHPYPELRSHVVSLLHRIGYPAELTETYRREGVPWTHPGKAVALTRGGPAIGYVAHLHPGVARDLGVPATTAIAALDLRALLASGRERAHHVPVPKFPSQPVDVALLVPRDARVGDLERFLWEVDRKTVRGVELFEVYRGEGVPPGMKSVNFTVVLGAAERTLDATDGEKYLARVRARAAEVGAELRG